MPNGARSRRYLAAIEKYTQVDQASDQFAKYLPYAIAFGLEKSWIEKFSRNPSAPAPTWYVPYAPTNDNWTWNQVGQFLQLTIPRYRFHLSIGKRRTLRAHLFRCPFRQPCRSRPIAERGRKQFLSRPQQRQRQYVRFLEHFGGRLYNAAPHPQRRTRIFRRRRRCAELDWLIVGQQLVRAARGWSGGGGSSSSGGAAVAVAAPAVLDRAV